MNEEPDEIYFDRALESLFESLYGSRDVPVCGWNSKREYDKALLKMANTLEKVITKNVHGDDAHRDELIEECQLMEGKIRNAKTILAGQHQCITFLFRIIFELLGNVPNNYHSRGVNYRELYKKFQSHRTFLYSRTDDQKVRKLLDESYCNRLGSNCLAFAELHSKWKFEMKSNSKEFLDWFAKEYPELWWKFVR